MSHTIPAAGASRSFSRQFSRADEPRRTASERMVGLRALSVELSNPALDLPDVVLTDASRPWYHPMELLLFVAGFVLPGLGMFTESYFIFTTGQIKTIWNEQYPLCWAPDSKAACPSDIACYGGFSNTPTPLAILNSTQCTADGFFPKSDFCEQQLIHAVSYSEFAGIMAGMLTAGFIAVRAGLKWTSVMNTSVMMTGAVFMISASSTNVNTIFLWFNIAYAVFGYGVGGEYPTAAVGATERHDEKAREYGEEATVDGSSSSSSSSSMWMTRGMAVQLMFSMQGWGAVMGSAVLVILLAGFGQTNPDCAAHPYPTGYSPDALNIIWRLAYALGLPVLCYTLYFRVFKVKEPKKRAQVLEAAKDDSGKPPFSKTFRLFLKHYWHRLFGCAMGWFLWDICFYGNKLFSGPIFSGILGSGTHLLSQNELILINNCVALVGYWCAAATIDRPWMGRVRLQLMGLLFSSILFFLCAGLWNELTPQLLLFLYMFSSFWGQFGPNATTYVLPSESFPSEVRTVAHGISAFTGKAGALLATILFNHLSTEQIFYVCGTTSTLACVITVIFIADLTGLELEEGERRWDALVAGTPSSYSGDAVNPRHLSLWEHRVMRLQRYYNPKGKDLEMVKGCQGVCSAGKES